MNEISQSNEFIISTIEMSSAGTETMLQCGLKFHSQLNIVVCRYEHLRVAALILEQLCFLTDI